jgi:predicted ArsR family transcriptional regulator
VSVLDALSQPELREIALFTRAEAEPVSADDVATRFEIHRTVARARLERLAAAGLLTVSFERRTGRSGPGAGRPTKLYSVPPETKAIEFPERHYDLLLGHVAGQLAAEGREAALTKAGVSFGTDLAAEAGLGQARGLEQAAENACAALGALGFQARVVDATDDSVTIATATCPLRPLVVANPADTAPIDRGLWIGLLEAHLERGSCNDVACEAAGCLDPDACCRVRLTFDTDKREKE